MPHLAKYPKSKEKILRFFREQLPELQDSITRIWLKDYYQLANRLAIAALLNKHGIKTRILCIYFVNGYRKRIVEKVVNLNATQEDFEKAIEKELRTLGIERNSVSKFLCPPVFVNAEP